MLEARLPAAVTLKRILDAIKDLVNDANFDCKETGIELQAMDSSHVALVALLLRAEGFDPYRCDRNMTLGVNFATLSKIMKCAANDDSLTIKADENADLLGFTFENPTNNRISEFNVKLMDVDADHLGIPETNYSAVVKLPSSEFQRICRDISVLSESIRIQVIKDTINFSASGETGSGSITLHSGRGVDNDDEGVKITLEQPVTLSFPLKYLNHFAKAATLASSVSLSLAEQTPLLVEFKMDENLGYIRYYLAPKISDD